MWRFFQTSTSLTQVHPNAIHMLGMQCSTGITYSWCVREALQPVLVVLYYCFNLNLEFGLVSVPELWFNKQSVCMARTHSFALICAVFTKGQ